PSKPRFWLDGGGSPAIFGNLNEVARRRKIAAHQAVIVSERRSLGPRRARMSLVGVRQPGVERPKSAKPTLRPSACVLQPDPHPGVRVCCKQKAKCHSTERSKRLFLCFLGSN